jgi:hypothetical protein
MKHEWEHLHIGIKDFGAYGLRQCRKCGLRQKKRPEYDWGRIIRYYWWPLSEGCAGKLKRKRNERK